MCVVGLVGWLVCKFDLFLFVKWILKSAEGGKGIQQVGEF